MSMIELEKFKFVSEIDPKVNKTWNEKTLITFDIDWAHDFIIGEMVDFLELNEIKSTLFITHKSPILERLKSSSILELGIHPNFNKLLNGNYENGKSVHEVIDNLLKIVPDAKSIRCHSLFESERLLDIFSEFGLKYVCNKFNPVGKNYTNKPYYLWDDLVIIPHHWQDNVSMRIDIDLHCKGLQVYDFHPIHIFLNTDQMDRYEETRHLHKIPNELKSFKNDTYGIHDIFMNIISV